MTQPTTFKTALPYGIGTLAIGTVGTITAVAATSSAVKILGVAIGIIGVYSFFATLICGYINAGKPEYFKRDIQKYVLKVIDATVKSTLIH